MIKEISYKKAKYIFDKHKDSIVIGSDTAVSLNIEILGKPERELLKHYTEDEFYTLYLKDEQVKSEARQAAYSMLKKLSGTTHEVITGICILSDKRQFVDCSVTKVTFIELTDDEIYDYVDTGELFGKAGGYAIQENAGKFVKSIEGDFFTIVGFPLNMVYQ